MTISSVINPSGIVSVDDMTKLKSWHISIHNFIIDYNNNNIIVFIYIAPYIRN